MVKQSKDLLRLPTSFAQILFYNKINDSGHKSSTQFQPNGLIYQYTSYAMFSYRTFAYVLINITSVGVYSTNL